MKRGRKTANQFFAEIEADPARRAVRDARNAELQARQEELGRAEAPLVAELRAAGVVVNSVYDLVNTREPYPAALPILIKHLDFEYPPQIVDGIARALAVPAARIAWRKIVERYKSNRDHGAQQGLALAIAYTANDDLIDEVIELARNREYGLSRGLLLLALQRSQLPKARAALEELASDPVIGKGAQNLLKKLDLRKRPPSRH
jgi:predicted nucleic acid-binding protein